MDQAVDFDRLFAEAGIELDDQAAAEAAIDRLGAHVRRCFEAAKTARETHYQEMVLCLQQRNSEYDTETLQLIREVGGSEQYMGVTQVLCRAAESWVFDLLLPPGQRPFGTEPTPIPDLEPKLRAEIEQRILQEILMLQAGGFGLPNPEVVEGMVQEVQSASMKEIQAQARDRCEKMEEYIADVVEEGGWKQALEEFVSDMVTFPAAFFKGPVRIKRKCLNWVETDYGEVLPATEHETVRTFRSVSPFDAYPSPSSRTVQDGFFIEVQRWRRKDLYNLIGVPGYDEDALRAVIHTYGDKGHKVNRFADSVRDHLEGRESEMFSVDAPIEGINFWGDVRGAWLLEWGLPETLVPNADDDYQANVIMIGDQIIRAAINPHPLGHRPYFSESWERVNGQVWGKGIPQLCRDPANSCNSAVRAILNNMALSSVPMADVQVDRLAEGESATDWYAGRVYQSKESQHGSSARPAVQFFQPQNNSEVLRSVFQFFMELAYEFTGIPPYATGQNTTSGAAGTATGMAMLQDNAARGIKRAIRNIDRVIRGSISEVFYDIMLYDDIPHIKGDLKIVAKGSSALVNRERQALRRTELMQAVQSPIYANLIPPAGHLEYLRQVFQSHDIDPTDIIPTDEEFKAMAMQRQQQEMAMIEAEQQEAAGSQNQAGMPPAQQPNQRAA